MVMGGDSCPEGCGFESQHCILDGHFSHIFVVKNFDAVCLKKTKINEKEAGDGPIFLHYAEVKHSERMLKFDFFKPIRVLYHGNARYIKFFLGTEDRGILVLEIKLPNTNRVTTETALQLAALMKHISFISSTFCVISPTGKWRKPNGRIR